MHVYNGYEAISAHGRVCRHATNVGLNSETCSRRNAPAVLVVVFQDAIRIAQRPTLSEPPLVRDRHIPMLAA